VIGGKKSTMYSLISKEEEVGGKEITMIYSRVTKEKK
jgi:hypothetical protein